MSAAVPFLMSVAPLLISFVVVIGALGGLVKGLRRRTETMRLLRDGKKATAEMIGTASRWETRAGGDWRPYDYPLYQFTTDAGQATTYESPTPTYDAKPGSKVVILYDPAEPSRARVHTWAGLHLVWLGIVTISGAILLLASYALCALAWAMMRGSP
ncbi:DUF3592 domain-containing protein [Reyranella sp. CPCC 100927]|uniref:DUF3592 domain-containing protein n=1 Tax=Reyranella sp. CPCC 100927 TaxID=2599616 RepID=UPI0011B42D30|nr:DUF3592 domain-containing protein [Reyranella sp. CPCC 100927]TWT14853.1 DUF3592 domain-containing protein [Reyranella sp. CPCC 100927]